MNKYFYFLLFTLLTGSVSAQQEIDLSGNWQFEIDRQDMGIQEKWHEKALSDHIKLPGSMPRG